MKSHHSDSFEIMFQHLLHRAIYFPELHYFCMEGSSEDLRMLLKLPRSLSEEYLWIHNGGSRYMKPSSGPHDHPVTNFKTFSATAD